MQVVHSPSNKKNISLIKIGDFQQETTNYTDSILAEYVT